MTKLQVFIYNRAMINKIKTQYYTYIPGEFTPVLREGQLDNKLEFHCYKIKKAYKRAVHYYWVIRYNYALLKYTMKHA